MRLFQTFAKPDDSLWPALLAKELHKTHALAQGQLPALTRPGFDDIVYPPFAQAAAPSNSSFTACSKNTTGWLVGQYISSGSPNNRAELAAALDAEVRYVHVLGSLGVLPNLPAGTWLAQETLAPSAPGKYMVAAQDPWIGGLLAGQPLGAAAGHVVRADLLDGIGARATQQLAYALSGLDGRWQVRQAEGVGIGAFIDEVWVYMAAGRYFFLELAKLRAMRWLLGRWLQEQQSPIELAGGLRMVGCTSQWTHSLTEPHNNLLRSTTEALSLVLGGANVLLVAPYVGPQHPEYDPAQRMARNLQHLLREEAHVALYQDAAQGAYIIDYLTQALTDKAWAHYQLVQAEGGWVAAAQSGWLARELQTAAAARAAQHEAFVGVNHYAQPTATAEDAAAAHSPHRLQAWRGPAQADKQAR